MKSSHAVVWYDVILWHVANVNVLWGNCTYLHFETKILSDINLFLGRAVLGGDKVRELPGHFCDERKPDGFDTKQIFLSPSIKYSGHDAYATPRM